jgi:protein-tyrosine phosphatase
MAENVENVWMSLRKNISLIFEEIKPDQDVFQIFLGGDAVAENEALLRQNNITSVVNCTVGFPNCHETKGICYHRVPILDIKGEDLLAHLSDVVNFINLARSRRSSLLIHCMWGMSRAPSIALAYFIHEEKMSLADSLKQIAAARNLIRPNPSFIRQLLMWENRHSNHTSSDDEANFAGPGSLDLEQYKVAYQLTSTARNHRDAGKQSIVCRSFPATHILLPGNSGAPSIVESLETVVSSLHQANAEDDSDGVPIEAAAAAAGEGWRACVCGGTLLSVRRISVDPRVAEVRRRRRRLLRFSCAPRQPARGRSRAPARPSAALLHSASMLAP